MMGGVDIARLAFAVDTSGLDRARAAQDATTASGYRLSQAADLASAKLTQVGRAGTKEMAGAAQDLNAAAQALAKARAALPSNWEQMTQKERTRWTFDNQGTWGNLQRARRDMEALTAAQTGVAVSAQSAAKGIGVFGVAAGVAAGTGLFQLISGVASLATGLVTLPIDAARASDALLLMNRQLQFAFQGSAESARQARNDIIAIADEVGISYRELAGQYISIAAAGRAANLTRREVSGLTEAFATLGRLTGADAGQIGRAQYQLGQALSIGQLTGMDARQMFSNLPALRAAMAQGLGVSSGQLQGMISRGEVNVDRLLQSIIDGTEKMKESAGDLPETMETAGNRLRSQWTLLLEQMGEDLQSSQLVQGFTNFLADAVHAFRTQQRPYGIFRNVREPTSIRDVVAGAVSSYGQEAADWYTENITRVRERADIRAMERNSIGTSRTQLTAEIDAYRTALSRGGEPEQMAAWTRALGAAQAQLARTGSVFQLLVADITQAYADFERYGGGAAFDLSERARGIVRQSAVQGAGASMPDVMAALVRQRALGARAGVGGENAELALAEQFLLPAAGGSAAARRRAQLEFDVARFGLQFGGIDSEETRAASSAQRDLLERRRAYEDATAIQERARADREALELMRERLEIGVRLGQQGRIALAQLEREQELRRSGLELSDEQLRAELDRVAAQVRVRDELDLQLERMARLQDAADTAGSTIGGVLGASIAEGVETGRVSGEAALRELARSTSRILDDILSTFTRPLEKRVSEFVGSRLERWLPGADPSADINALGEAASKSAEKIAQEMAPSVADVAAKTALSATATAQEAAVRSKSTFAMVAFSSSVAKATLALEAMAAAASAEGSSSIASSLVNLFSAHGNVFSYGLGGVRGSPQMFAMAGGMGLWGEAGAEAILPLKRGPDGKLGVASDGSGGGDVQVNIIDQRGPGAAPVETRQSTGPDGRRVIEVMVKDEVSRGIRKGDFDAPMKAQYGSARVMKKV